MSQRSPSRVLLLALGGTIACEPVDGVLLPRLRARDLLSRVAPPDRADVESRDLLRRTIVFPPDWVTLSDAIAEAWDRFDGFVITLGTDTLAHVACALTLMLEGLSKPVVLTGAMTPIHAPQSEAARNLRDALRVASCGAPGVSVVFGGQVIDGHRASKVRCDKNAAFESVGGPPRGAVDDDGLRWADPPPRSEGRPRLRTGLDPRVALFKLTPQVEPAWLEHLAGYRGVVLEGFGDGNVPTHLVAPLASLASRAVVVLKSQCLYGRAAHRYEGGAALVRDGVLSAGEMTTEMACVTLMWALGNGADRPAAIRLFHEVVGRR